MSKFLHFSFSVLMHKVHLVETDFVKLDLYWITLFQNFNLYVPKQQSSLDEAVPWRGRIGFRTYKSAKITKYEKKVQETTLSILELYLGYWHHVYQDNSVSTARILLEKKTLACGTIRENRGLQKALIKESKNLWRGQMTF